MSGRRRRSESLWDRKEEAVSQTEISGKVPYSSFHGDGSPKRSNSEANDALMSGDFSGEPMQGHENMSTDNDNNSDRHRMKTDPAFDEWENQYSSRPSDSSYGLPYRGGDRGVGGTRNMSKDRDRSKSRSWSPYRSRGRDRDRGGMRGLARSRSRSRSRGRDQGRARSPFSGERREAYESADVRNDSRVPSRPCKDFASGNCRRGSQCRFLHQEHVDSRGGGNRMDNDSTEKWSSRPEYSGGSRFRDDRNSADRPRHKGPDGYRKDAARNEEARDYHRGSRNAYDDQDHKRQSNQSIKAPCRFFSMGKCNRNNCNFSHDVPNSGGYEGRSHDTIQGHNSGNNNRPWNERQPQDLVNASGFSDLANSNRNFDDKNKSWNGPTWNDLKSGGFNETSRDCVQGHTLDDKNRTWDPQGWNESEKKSCILSQPRSVTNDMDMTSNELCIGNQESQLIHDSSQSHNSDAPNIVSGEIKQLHSYGEDLTRVNNIASQFPSTLNGTEKTSDMLSQSSLNGPKLQLNGSVQGMFLQLDLQKQTEIQNKPDGKPLEASKTDIPQVTLEMNTTLGSTEHVPQVSSSLPVSLPQISQNINIANALEFLYSLPNSASSVDPVNSMVVQPNLDTNSKEQYESARDTVVNKSTETSVPNVEQKPVGNMEINEKNRIVEDPKQENMNIGKTEAQGKVEEGNIGNDEKAMRQFKIALVEFVKEILKPTWKEGKMSREVYKTIVKKVVDKVTSTIQGVQIPRTQEKIDQYLAFSKSKITKLVEAYVGRFLKA